MSDWNNGRYYVTTRQDLVRVTKTIKNLSVTDDKAWNSTLWRLIGSRTQSGEQVDEGTALTYSAVWAAVQLISSTVSTLPLHLLTKKQRTTSKVTENPLYSVLHARFNPYMTAQIGREVMTAHILTWGNCYAEIIRDQLGAVRELWPIGPDRVTPEMSDGGVVYRVRVGSETKILPRERVLHVPGLGYDGLIGYSVIAMARKSIGLGMAMETFGERYFGAGTHPGVIVSHPGQLKDPTKLRDSLAASYSGLGQSHRLMLLEEGMKIENVGIPPNDSQFLECVVPETLITMADGTRKAAKDIKLGDNLVTWEKGKVGNSFVSAVGKPPIKNLIKIKTARGRELIASEDHPVLAIDKLRTPGCRVPKINPEKWTPIKNLKIGSYVRIALEIPPIKSSMTTDEGYFLGAMAGDGYIRKACCSFTNNDPGVITHIREIIESFGGELKSRGGKLNEFNHEIITNGKGGCKGSYIRSLFNDSGMVGQHSQTKTVPQSVILGGPDAWKGFLSGYFDTDGSIRKRGGKQKAAMYWSSTSYSMLQECQHLLAMLGIQSSIYPMSPGGTKKIMGMICKYLPSWGLYVMGAFPLKIAAQTLSLYHGEKKKRLSEYLKAEPSKYRDINFHYDRVVSIEEMGDGETIGIEVFGCHTHITSGIVTHNSRQFQIPEIARWFNLPPHKLKDLTKSSFSNIESEQISFVTDSILPWLVRFEQHYNMQLLTETEQKRQIYTKHNMDGLMRGDSAARAAYYARMWGHGFMTINEIREKEDWDPDPNPYADELFIPVNNMIPMSKIDEFLAKGQMGKAEVANESVV